MEGVCRLRSSLRALRGPSNPAYTDGMELQCANDAGSLRSPAAFPQAAMPTHKPALAGPHAIGVRIANLLVLRRRASVPPALFGSIPVLARSRLGLLLSLERLSQSVIPSPAVVRQRNRWSLSQMRHRWGRRVRVRLRERARVAGGRAGWSSAAR